MATLAAKINLRAESEEEKKRKKLNEIQTENRKSKKKENPKKKNKKNGSKAKGQTFSIASTLISAWERVGGGIGSRV